ncbi:MAG: DEAD/DEAH box helicase family protein [Acidobacteria bacterium]|nr:DEAD/DEAH box helicase family protein [Acidobacteriota bacterium]
MKDVRFQKDYIKEIADTAVRLLQDRYRPQSTIIFKAPTGSGKTYMISQALADIVKAIGEELAFIWISVNSLHEQSRENLSRYLEDERLLECISVDEINDTTIEQNEIVFFNWESLIKTNNVFRLDNERDWNLKTVCSNTKEEGRKIVLIIDESHRIAKAAKAKEVIAEIDPALIIEMTATPSELSGSVIEIPLGAVIAEGMIKKEVVINPYAPGMSDDAGMLDIALRRRLKLKDAYKALGKNINPLLLVQVPDKRAGEASNPEDEIIGLLADRNHTTSKGNLAIWLSDKKENRDLLELNDSPVDVLIFKQAIAVGWDCPRAAILFLQREWSTENYRFNIQTLGRIMRMPEQIHYDKEPELNVGYVYTASHNFDIVDELAGDYVSELQMVRDENIYERPVKIVSEFIRRKVELTRISSDFKQCVLQAASELGTKDSINANVKEVQKKIMVGGSVKEIDKKQTVVFEREYAYRKGQKQISDDYGRWTVEQARPEYMPKSSSGAIKSAIRSWFKDAFDDGDEDRIARVVTQGNNRPKFVNLIARAKEIYGSLPDKGDQIVSNDAWEVPEGVSLFKVNYAPLAKSRKSILKEQASQSYFVRVSATGKPELSNPEEKFIELLESSDDETRWWFKNGVRDSKYLGIGYKKPDGHQYGFYPDFVIKTKKEVLIVEIKDDKAFATDNFLKLRAGKEYLTKYAQKEKLRFFVLSPDDFAEFFRHIEDQSLDSFRSLFEERLLRWAKSSQVVLENKAEKTDDDSELLKYYEDEFAKVTAELKDANAKKELLEIDLQQAQENLKAMGTAAEKENKGATRRLAIPTPFNICVLGEVSNVDAITQELQAYFTKHSVKTNDWSVDFVNNTKLKNSNVLKSLVKGQSKYDLIVTGQIYHHAGKGNAKSNILSELKNEKYVPHVVGVEPKSLLTPDRAVESVDNYLEVRYLEIGSLPPAIAGSR